MLLLSLFLLLIVVIFIFICTYLYMYVYIFMGRIRALFKGEGCEGGGVVRGGVLLCREALFCEGLHVKAYIF
jgi:hypothetical protein